MRNEQHVLIIVENLPAPPDYRAWRIATALRDAGWRVSVVSPATDAWPAGTFEIDGITVYRHWMPREARRLPGYLVEYFVALVQELRLSIRVFFRARFHVIHACNPPDLIWVVALVWRLFGVAFVYDHHDLCPELLLAKSGVQSPAELGFVRRLLYRGLLAMERISHRLARVVIATNDSYRAVAIGRNGCAEERVFTVKTSPLAAELDQLDSLDALDGRGKMESVPRIAYVGVMARQDGVDGLLRVAHRLHTMLKKKFELVLIGDGPERDMLTALAVELGIENLVRFAGFLPREQMVREVRACMIGVTPDPPCPMNNASTMLKVLDYMACGIAQAMYDLPENRASAGDAAVYVLAGDESAFAQALADLLDNSAQRAALAAAAHARIRAITWENCGAPKLLEAYAKIA